MKKMMVAIAMMALAFGVFAEAPYAKDKTFTVAAAGTVFTNTLADFGNTYKLVERVTIKNDTTNTATVVLYTVDCGVFTQIGTSGSLAAGASAVVYPWRTYLVYEGVTNKVPYEAQLLKAITTMGAANGVAADIQYNVYSK